MQYKIHTRSPNNINRLHFFPNLLTYYNRHILTIKFYTSVHTVSFVVNTNMSMGATKDVVKYVMLVSCGSFNPPTFMHLRMFELAKNYLQANTNCYAFAGMMSPVNCLYKKKDLISGEHRLAMCRQATSSSDWIFVDPWECEQKQWSRTVLVLRHARELLKSVKETSETPATYTALLNICMRHKEKLMEGNNCQIMLLCGADFLESFSVPGLWASEDIEEIVKTFGLVVITRKNSDPFRFVHESDILYRYRKNIHLITEWIPNEISSTAIRRALKRNESVQYLIPEVFVMVFKTFRFGTCFLLKDFFPNPVCCKFCSKRISSTDTRHQPDWIDEFIDKNFNLRKSAFDEVMAVGRSCSLRSALIIESTGNSLSRRNMPQLKHKFNISEGNQAVYICEFKDSLSFNRFLDQVSQKFTSNVFPMKSRIIKCNRGVSEMDVHSFPKLACGFEKIDFNHLYSLLGNASTANQQIDILFQHTKIHKEGMRLRFFLTTLIEDAVRRCFPFAICRPFGSTVNGFAQKNCDLDVNIQLCTESIDKLSADQYYFCSRCKPKSERTYIQNTLSILADVLGNFMPSFTHVQKILHARVPIIKLYHQTLGISCDITLDNKSAYKTARVFWLFGKMNAHFKPLLFAVRYWAKQIGLTRPHPGPYITNFHIICLVTFFLQSRSPPLLPAIDKLLKNDFQMNEWIKDHVYPKTKTIELLVEFFNFYSKNVNCQICELNLRTATVKSKPSSSLLVIWNPFEEGHNVCKNINEEEFQRFLLAIKEAANITESMKYKKDIDDPNWGLLSLFLPSNYTFGISWKSNLNDHHEHHSNLQVNELLSNFGENRATPSQVSLFTDIYFIVFRLKNYDDLSFSLMERGSCKEHTNDVEDQKIKVSYPKGTYSPYCQSFTIEKEDHTLGVRFCSYNVPHPMEDRILLHIETDKSVSAVDIFKRGLKQASFIFETLKTKVEEAVSKYKN
ncbi:Nicotinamide mononucleotide adenylyltransferase 1 [Trichinella papuae]|uniref:Nicotinamide/nicotinic acid mononucleotide adenylyltransferase 3 n=1 Tax=Trichinella papuae TaxID=268474 RepID=A0A0V1N5Z8_9BILA|nr:Nicotinamide mononucleotide adenylyltransferase 1 [Trichinella papuae]KRZ79405.1 Nicotinamide mononucleotide adenylyltransferase 1 [Trichinella papuae]